MTSLATTSLASRDSEADTTRAPKAACNEPAVDASLSPAAWLQSVLSQFEGPLLRYAHRITGDIDRARDIVQETFLRACREDRRVIEAHLARWLFHVCRNQAVDAHRKEQRMSVASDLDLQSRSGGASPPELLESKETQSQLMTLLEGLPANQQEVIRLKFQNELTYREIAEITGLSVSHVGVLLHSGLKRLRERMKDCE